MPDDSTNWAPIPSTGRTHEPRIVGFLDMLGAKANETSEKFLNALASTIGRDYRLQRVQPFADELDFRTIWFSDNIGASMRTGSNEATAQAAYDHVAWHLGDMQAQLLAVHGISSRGGIARGTCHHTDQMIFGPALVEAYLTESRAAGVPRILVAPSAAPLAVSSTRVPWLDDHDGKGPYVDFIAVGRPAAIDDPAAYHQCIADEIAAGLAEAEALDLAEQSRARVIAGWNWLQARLDAAG